MLIPIVNIFSHYEDLEKNFKLKPTGCSVVPA